MTTPNPLLVAKMTRLALQILATDTMRPTVTSAVMGLVMESVSLASPKLRRELIDCHWAALDWVLRDAFTSQVAPPVASVTAAEIVIDGNIRQAIEKVIGSMDEELGRAWDYGYTCGAADHVPNPADDSYVGISNPYTLEKGDSTP